MGMIKEIAGTLGAKAVNGIINGFESLIRGGAKAVQNLSKMSEKQLESIGTQNITPQGGVIYNDKALNKPISMDSKSKASLEHIKNDINLINYEVENPNKTTMRVGTDIVKAIEITNDSNIKSANRIDRKLDSMAIDIYKSLGIVGNGGSNYKDSYDNYKDASEGGILKWLGELGVDITKAALPALGKGLVHLVTSPVGIGILAYAAFLGILNSASKIEDWYKTKESKEKSDKENESGSKATDELHVTGLNEGHNGNVASKDDNTIEKKSSIQVQNTINKTSDRTYKSLSFIKSNDEERAEVEKIKFLFETIADEYVKSFNRNKDKLSEDTLNYIDNDPYPDLTKVISDDRNLSYTTTHNAYHKEGSNDYSYFIKYNNENLTDSILNEVTTILYDREFRNKIVDIYTSRFGYKKNKNWLGKGQEKYTFEDIFYDKIPRLNYNMEVIELFDLYFYTIELLNGDNLDYATHILGSNTDEFKVKLGNEINSLVNNEFDYSELNSLGTTITDNVLSTLTTDQLLNSSISKMLGIITEIKQNKSITKDQAIEFRKLYKDKLNTTDKNLVRTAGNAMIGLIFAYGGDLTVRLFFILNSLLLNTDNINDYTAYKSGFGRFLFTTFTILNPFSMGKGYNERVSDAWNKTVIHREVGATDFNSTDSGLIDFSVLSLLTIFINSHDNPNYSVMDALNDCKVYILDYYPNEYINGNKTEMSRAKNLFKYFLGNNLRNRDLSQYQDRIEIKSINNNLDVPEIKVNDTTNESNNPNPTNSVNSDLSKELVKSDNETINKLINLVLSNTEALAGGEDKLAEYIGNITLGQSSYIIQQVTYRVKEMISRSDDEKLSKNAESVDKTNEDNIVNNQ